MRHALALGICTVCAVLLTSSQNPGAPRGGGSPPSTGGNTANIADPPGPLAGPRLPPLPDGGTPPSLAEIHKLGVYDFDPAQGLAADDFTLWTVGDLGQPDRSVHPFLRLEGRKMDFGAYHLVIYLRDSPGLYDMLFYVRYHQDRWHPRQIEPGSAFGFPGDRLFMGKLDVPGVVVGAVTRVRPDVNGPTKLDEGVICEVVFEQRPFDFKPKQLTHAPEGASNQPANVQVYEDDGIDALERTAPERTPRRRDPVVTLYWEERLVGDYNNDGEVGVGDLVPIGRRYGKLSVDGIEDDWDRLPDGNGDGEITYRDQWLVQEHFGSLLSGYRVYRRPAGRPRGEERMLPHRTNPLLPFSIHRPRGWEPTREVPYRYFDADLPRTAVPTRWTYRIAPYDAVSGTEGVASSVELTVSVTDSALRPLDRRPVDTPKGGSGTKPKSNGRT